MELKTDKKAQRPVMIQVSGLRKKYRLGKIGADTLQGAIKEWREQRKEKRKGSAAGKEKTGTQSGSTFYALDGIDLTVYKGETLGIIGKNGAGKSTLLKILSRITAPSEGSVDLYGRVTSMLEVGTGFHGDMTGRENIYLNGAILGMTRAEIDSKIDDIIQFSELEGFIDTPIKRYSSGMFIKLGFSVAYHLESEIVIMDEVLAVGDTDFQQKCLSSMRKTARDDGRTVLYVSHNMSTVRQLCDRCIVLDKGKILFDGDTSKAIGYYLGAVDLMPTEIIYGPQHRPDDHIIRAVKLLTIEKMKLVSHRVPVFRSSDTAVFEMECTAEQTLDQLGLRFEFWFQDRSKVATSLAGNFVRLEKGRSAFQISLSLRHLVPGRYSVDIVAFLFDGTRMEHKIDALYPGFGFQIDPEKDGTDYLEWNHKYWGAIRLDDMTISPTRI